MALDDSQLTKQCKYCLYDLPRERFGVDRSQSDGLSQHCPQCRYIVQKYRKNPDQVFLHELPIAYRNRAVLTNLIKRRNYTFETEDSDNRIVHISTTKKYLTFKVMKDDKLEGQIEFVSYKYDTCIEWLIQYLNENQIWLKPQY